MKRTVILALVLAPMLGSGPAFSQDDEFVGREPCGIFCKIWRNASGHVNLPASATRIDNTPYERRAPDEGVQFQIPKSNRIVAVHGEVMVETRAERARRERERQAMLKSFMVETPDPTSPASAERPARAP